MTKQGRRGWGIRWRRAVSCRFGWPVLVVFFGGLGGAGFWGVRFERGRGGVGVPAWRLAVSGPFIAAAVVWWSRAHGQALAAHGMRPAPALLVSWFQ